MRASGPRGTSAGATPCRERHVRQDDEHSGAVSSGVPVPASAHAEGIGLAEQADHEVDGQDLAWAASWEALWAAITTFWARGVA